MSEYYIVDRRTDEIVNVVTVGRRALAESVLERMRNNRHLELVDRVTPEQLADYQAQVV